VLGHGGSLFQLKIRVNAIQMRWRLDRAGQFFVACFDGANPVKLASTGRLWSSVPSRPVPLPLPVIRVKKPVHEVRVFWSKIKIQFFSQECEREHNCFYQAMTPGIITRCASCAAPIPYTAPRCGRCHTRYFGSACQTQHWNEGGHSKDICKMIKRRGGAERFYADQKYN
jgi:hypothetical protein